MSEPNLLTQHLTHLRRPDNMVPKAVVAWDPNAKFEAAIGMLLNGQTANDELAENTHKAEWHDPLSRSPGVRRQKAKELLDQGLLPPLWSGYQFIIDRRPEGEEDQPIPSAEYTAYFSRRQVPIADIDHKEHEHDLGHIPTFQDMFNCQAFGDIVQLAAYKSLGDVEACKRFTRAMDSFGDDLRNLEEMDYSFRSHASFRRSSFLQSARRNLQDLLIMGMPPVPGNPKIREERDKLSSVLWLALGLHGHKVKADYEARLAREHAELVDYEGKLWQGQHEEMPVEYKFLKPDKLAALSTFIIKEHLVAA